MAFSRIQAIRKSYRVVEFREPLSLFGSLRTYSTSISNVVEISWSCTSSAWKGTSAPMWDPVHKIICRSISSCSNLSYKSLPWTPGHTRTPNHTTAADLQIFFNGVRLLTAQAKAPAQARHMGAVKVSMTSPGFVYDPYEPREPIPFWKRYFTRSGWRRTKEDIMLEMKSAYATAKLRKKGYSKQRIYAEALDLYKEQRNLHAFEGIQVDIHGEKWEFGEVINTYMANGDKTSLRKPVTEKMYSTLKNEIKQRESVWSKVYWEFVEPPVKIRTLRARLASIIFLSIFLDYLKFAMFSHIGVDKNDLEKVFVQLTLEFLTKQVIVEKFEAYDSSGAVVAGDKNKEVLVRDIWVFEKSLFHPGAFWRLCGKIPV
ncbi:Tim44-like domain [Dillenia turbinata]|uniref:Large ribosomal subunit protein mL45 n=1 Tax=Dillenia turbinata TaxID=194707 RepID=A0AAN8UMI5_9MAGN